MVAALLTGCSTGGKLNVRPLGPTASVPASPFESAYQAGKNHLLADELGLAIVMFQKALAINPIAISALNANGIVYDELHRSDVAKRYYMRALAIEPNSLETLNNMGVSLRLAGKPNEARYFFQRAMAVDNSNKTIRANLARLDEIDTMPSLTASTEQPEERPDLERSGLAIYTLTIHPSGTTHWRESKEANARTEDALEK
jgi:Flp pilus assembly protein TadD